MLMERGATLSTLSGRTHEVITAVSLVSAGRETQAVSTSQVQVAALSDADIAACIASGEWDGKAGAYAIQGRFQAHIEHLSGSYSGIMGLPVFETAALLRTSRKAVYSMVERGQLPGVTRIGRRVLFRRPALLDWLRQKSTPSL